MLNPPGAERGAAACMHTLQEEPLSSRCLRDPLSDTARPWPFDAVCRAPPRERSTMSELARVSYGR